MVCQVRLLMGMLSTSPWRYYPLTLQFMSQQHSQLPRGVCACVSLGCVGV